MPSAFQSGIDSSRFGVSVSRAVPVTPGNTTQMSTCPCEDRPNAMSPLLPGKAALAVVAGASARAATTAIPAIRVRSLIRLLLAEASPPWRIP